MQLFHSIFTGKNRSLKKFNKLAGSIVILDEVQSLPERYMPLIAAALTSISKYLGTRFILMTATQPRLLESAGKIISKSPASLELLPNNKMFFQVLKRTRFIPSLKKARYPVHRFFYIQMAGPEVSFNCSKYYQKKYRYIHLFTEKTSNRIS